MSRAAARRAVTVLDVGLVDHGSHQQAHGVGQDVALAALDLLAGVKPARPAALGGLDALAVDHAGTWAMPRGPFACFVQSLLRGRFERG